MPVNSFDDYYMSWRPTIERGKKALYIAIADQLEEDIKNGVILPGTKLPPQRELADFLDVNVSTISKAFKRCELKGIITATIGSGTFVAYDANTNSYMMPGNKDYDLIEMASVFPNSDLNEEIVDKVRELCMESNFGSLFTYGRIGGELWQRNAAVEFIRRAGHLTTEDRVLFSNGGQSAITAILASIFKSGDKIGVDPLTYPGIKTSAKMLGIQLISIAQENGEMSREGILYACKQENIKGLYVIPSYQNPTTKVMSLATRRMIAEVAQEKNLIVIEDSINNFFSEKRIECIANYASENVISIYSLSKTVAPGLRLAYIVAPDRYKQDLSDSLYNMSITVPLLMLEIASRMIVSELIYKLIENKRELCKVYSKIVREYLGGYTLIGSDECIFKWLIIPDSIDDYEFERKAAERGVRVLSSDKFTVGKKKQINAIRISIMSTSSIEELKRGLSIIKELLEEN